MPKVPTLRLHKRLEGALRGGHPWIFDGALSKSDQLVPGQIVRVVGKDDFEVFGFCDPAAAIRVRVLDRRCRKSGWAEELARSAASARRTAPSLADVTGLRLVHGENDYAPGLVIDAYDRTAVVKLDGAGAAAFWTPRLEEVIAGLASAGFVFDSVWRKSSKGVSSSVVAGAEPPDVIVIEEGAARFPVDVRKGQKTGFFLDQRDNRRLVGALSSGQVVLNLFSYSGGFSVHAALAGAARTISVDIAAPAIEDAKEAFRLSGLNPSDHAFEAVDVFEYLSRARAKNLCFDLVVCDPPSFAPSEKAKKKATKAYIRLNRVALDRVAPGGLFVTASCSSHISGSEFRNLVAEAGRRSGRRLRFLRELGAGSDHPVRPGFEEGRYLCGVLAYVD
jgi:23S rRNA (cytosine1962-C5)-methyltransferase